MNILDTIIAHKKNEVEERKRSRPAAMLEKTAFFQRPVLSLKEYLLDEEKTGIIAEFKRRSPSKGIINAQADVLAVTAAYTKYGASCLSVLTDEHFFGGSTADLEAARVQPLPLLRKDFVIDEYQLLEAKAMGADVILLIAACLTVQQVASLARFAKSLGLEVLLELHAEEELGHICTETSIIGINNRNLKTFEVDINRSLKMAQSLPSGSIKVAESGIGSADTVQLFKENGFSGFLMGENFMKEADPGEAFARFVEALNARSSLSDRR
ncbi:MAG TPA: indole-3-glycerol phosphate synthase TrpC [Chitinophagaceae bacterium]|nr:indole-3-glycerol phosphate synthase TrpC [Chitinophagaceae bacterium]